MRIRQRKLTNDVIDLISNFYSYLHTAVRERLQRPLRGKRIMNESTKPELGIVVIPSLKRGGGSIKDFKLPGTTKTLVIEVPDNKTVELLGALASHINDTLIPPGRSSE